MGARVGCLNAASGVRMGYVPMGVGFRAEDAKFS